MGAELRNVWAEDGVRGLFRGHSATLYRVVPYAAIQFAAFDFAKAEMSRRKGYSKKLEWYELLVGGAFAGAVSVAATYPLDLMRARMAVRGFRDGVWANLKSSYRDFGPSSLYRGLSPTLLGILPYAGLSCATCATLTALFQGKDRKDVTTPERLLFGTLAGIAGQFCTYPIDIVRRRMQVEGYVAGQSPAEQRKYRGVWQSLVLIVREEGARALYKAVGMNFVKGPVAVGVSFATHDFMIKVLR